METKILHNSEPPEYPFGGYDADGLKQVREEDFEVYPEERPFDFWVNEGRAEGWHVVAKVTVLAHSGYEAIKMVAEICPGYFYEFVDEPMGVCSECKWWDQYNPKVNHGHCRHPEGHAGRRTQGCFGYVGCGRYEKITQKTP